MGFTRKNYVLLKETGVLPGSENFVATHECNHDGFIHYLAQCGHYYCGEGYKIERRYFEYIFIAYIVQGTLNVTYDHKKYILQKSDILILDFQDPHCYASSGPLEFVWIHSKGGFGREIFREIYKECGPVINSSCCEYVFSQIQYLISSLQTGRYLNISKVSSIVYDILCSLLPDPEPSSNIISNPSISSAIDYMKSNFTNPISITDVAEAAHMSKFHFSRLFRQCTGQSPYDYLIRLRIETAKHLLVSTNKTVKEIAFLIGYSSEMGFTIAFSKNVSISPGRYRHHPI